MTADHGETLYEHERYFGHDMQLYDTALRIPLVISGGGVPGGRVVREQARTRDVAPTVLGLVGLLPGGEMVGRDLFREPPPRGDAADFIAETHPAPKKAPPLYALRTEARKVVWQPRRRRWEHYDLEKDPRELVNLLDRDDPTLRIMGEDLELDLRNRPVGETQTIDDERGGPDEATQNALRSLGYID